VLEDLDALVTEKSKSFFLNELDGLTDNTGVIVLASTNWPERLDPALRDRPSRFDRRYTFALPGRAERIRWLERWDGRSTHADVRLGEVARRTVAAETAGFSYAFLQELLVAGMLGWVAAGGEGSLLPHVREALGVLRDQVGTEGPPED
ncbi:MAG: AAA family ATPase, partial [Myxococcales bacterium]|nr:AAA family ATPase [Myxococcales bacterium]